jgi:outer membrane protein assembly factor BamD (BamD/ComL family)
MSEANKHLFFKHFLGLMRIICVVFILFLELMMSVQCRLTASDFYNEGVVLYNQGKYDDAVKAYDELD